MSAEAVVVGIRNAALIPITLLDDHPENPRVQLGNIAALTISIRRQGVLTPGVVRPTGDRFQLLAGHRRKAAAQKAGLDRLPCVVRRDIPDADVLPTMLTENVQRRDLNPIEEARAFQRLVDRGYTQTEIGTTLGISGQRVSQRLGLLLLDEQIQQQILDGQVTLAEAWAAARELRQRKGPKAGEGTHRTTRYDRYFNWNHPLAHVAFRECDGQRHSGPSRLGPACGPCWELAIRAHERGEVVESAPMPGRGVTAG